MRLLLSSNSTMPGTPFFSWLKPFVKDFLSSDQGNAVFIPYAAVTFSYDDYEDKVREVFDEFGMAIKSIHHYKDQQQAVRQAGTIVVGGGNTFALLTRLYQAELLPLIREKVSEGVNYVGWSAGANLACPTIMTTNDMPVIQPPSFESLNLIPFQINPHYTEYKQPGQGGETRIERIKEFVSLNPQRKVLGLPEGTLIQREDDALMLKGAGTAKLFSHQTDIVEIDSTADISYLLN